MSSLFRINTNIQSLFAQRQLSSANRQLKEANQRLSSGKRINSAADDAAGLAVTEKMTTQIRGLQMATRNAQDGISMLQTAEGALDETQSMIQRMRELAIQASSDSLTSEDRDQIQKEVNNLAIEMQRIADDTQFNERRLLDGTLQNAQFQVGANEGQRISFSIGDLGTEKTDADTGQSALNIAEYGGTDQTINNIGTTTSTSGADDIDSTDQGTYEVVRDTSDNLIIQDSSGTTVAETLTSTKDEGVVFQGVTADSGSGFGNDKLIFETAVTEGNFDINSAGTVVNSSINPQEVENGEAKTTLEAGKYTVEFASADSTFQLIDEDGNVVGETFGSVGNREGVFFSPDDSTQQVLSFEDATGFDIGSSGVVSGLGMFTGGEEITVGGPNISQNLGKAEDAIGQLDEALEEVTGERTDIGALLNRLERTMSVNNITEENLQAARSRIADADIAKESVKRTRANILIQATTSVLSQANQNPQLALQLLGGGG